MTFDCEGLANGTALPGTACNDSNANTINDAWDANCTCSGTPVTFDCEGVACRRAVGGRMDRLARHRLQRQQCEHDQRCVERELHLRWNACDL
ncbi:MAG: hypothetical protein IPO05_13285 [Flavobacteriales bacterium]|nr:hypothetical protein [Flavobacteriales bacterium]